MKKKKNYLELFFPKPLTYYTIMYKKYSKDNRIKNQFYGNLLNPENLMNQNYLITMKWCLLDISSDSFKSILSPLVLIIKSLIFWISLLHKFFGVPSHVGIDGNEQAMTDQTKFHRHFFCLKCLLILPTHRKLLCDTWPSKRFSLNYIVTWCYTIKVTKKSEVNKSSE